MKSRNDERNAACADKMNTLTSYMDQSLDRGAQELQSASEESVVAFDTSPLPLKIKGVKAAVLERLAAGGLQAPSWFLTLPEAMLSGSRRVQQEEFLQLRDPTKVKYFAQRCAFSARAVDEITLAVNRLLRVDETRMNERDAHFAVRVSLSPNEAANRLTDVEPLLCLRADDVPDALLRVWQSIYSDEALSKRLSAGMELVMPPPALIVQRMVRADVSGLAYGGDPLTGRRGATVVAAVYGLGTSITSGESDADTYEYSRDRSMTRRDIACKQIAHVLDMESGYGVSVRLIPVVQQELPLMTEAQVSAVSELTWQVGALYDCPQEIEWAMEAGRISLLGARPAPALARLTDPDAKVTEWSRETLAVSYPGVLSSLSYTLARYTIAEQYGALLRVAGAPDEPSRANRSIRGDFAGQIDGAVYLNRDTARDLLATLPQLEWQSAPLAECLGISGVSGGLHDAVAQDDPPATLTERESADVIHLDVLGNSRFFSLLQTQSARHDALQRDFTGRLNRTLGLLSAPIPLVRQRLDELVERLQAVRREVVEHWDAPAANQLVAAAAKNLVGQLTAAWCEDSSGALQRELLRNPGEVPGTAALRKIELIAAGLHDANLAEEFRTGSAGLIRKALTLDANTPLRLEIGEYLETWGDVIPGGFKVEEATLRENPLPLFRVCAKLSSESAVDLPLNLLPSMCVSVADVEAVKQARSRAERYYSDRTIRRRYFDKVYALARQHARQQEVYHFDAVRVFAAMRALLIEIGKRLYAINALETPQQILHLELDEVLGYVTGSGSCSDLQGLAHVRSRQFTQWSELATNRTLPNRLTASQPVFHSVRLL